MAVTPFRAKAEERAKLKANESESPEPPSKRVCNTYEKQLAKLPKGDLQTVKDLLDYVSSFRGESSGAHPASLISELYGASEHSNMLHCQQIEGWYAEYANTVRNMPYLYKKPSQVEINPSMAGEVVKLPITCLRFNPPEDGIPVCEDWIGTFESMVLGGIELQREPLDISMIQQPGSWLMEAQSVDQVKGWTRSSVVMLILTAASELDLSDSQSVEKLRPLFGCLDKAWLLPCHVAFDLGDVDRSFRNMSLSFRGSERQAPSSLQLALRFSRILESKATNGEHPSDWNTEQRLTAVVQEFNETSGLQSKHRIEDDRYKAVLNLLTGSCEESRTIIRQHLDAHKWHQSAFSTEQFKGARWLLTAAPKAATCPADLRKCLTVTPQSQVLHLCLVIKTFLDGGRRLRPSARSKARLSPSEFDKLCDFSCIYSYIWGEAKLLTSWTPEKDAAMEKAFFQKDYAADIEAAVTAKLSTWKPEHLALWVDLVDGPKAPAAIPTPAEMVEIEDQAQAAKFREVRAKISQDIMDMAAYNSKQDESKRRSHVVTVMHEKSQVMVGKQLCDVFMEKHCRVSMSTKKDGCDLGLDQAIRVAAAQAKVDAKDVDTILYFDCPKLGVLSQAEINMVGDMSEKVLGKNPTRSVLVLIPPLLVGTESGGSLRSDLRKLEDKLLASRIEMRAFTLNLDLSEIHGNRDLPSAFICYLGVCDATLPLKGTAHRSIRGAPAPDDRTNVFCASHLWTRQSLPLGKFPKALEEKGFVVPGEAFLSHDTRRSLTDLQETAQWMGGQAVPAALLEALTGDRKSFYAAVVVNPTTYDGCLELAGVKGGYTVLASSGYHPAYTCSKELVKTHLLEAWKNGRAPMANVLPRYRKNPPAEELPSDPAKPEMRICQISDGKLVVPRDVRQCFLTCPIWGPEWRQFLQDFDRDWGVAIPSSSPQKPASTPTPEKTLAKQEVKETSEEFWAKHFKEDPKTVDALKSKFGDDITEMAGADQASSLILTPGPQLYIAAKDATCLQLSATVPLISHGAGTWLLGAKADKFKSENPNKGIPCSWSSDEVPVIVEEDNTDGEVCTLRAALQAFETKGHVDYTLGGHSCVRPPGVQQGKEDDKFSIAPDANNTLVWKPNAVNAKNIKAANVASCFPWPALESSPLEVVWRLRYWPNEKCIAAAKPLYFMPMELTLAKGACQRVV